MTSYANTPTPDEVAEAVKPEVKPEEKIEKGKEISPVLESGLISNPTLWKDVNVIFHMHNYCRPHQSRTEQAFIKEFLMPLKGKFDKKGNYHVTIGEAPVLWSSHTDTVHTKKGMQHLEYWTDQKSGDLFVGTAAGDKASCLGADDTAGVWLMTDMIKNKVPGHYVFHRGEECGGIGSKWIADNCKDFLKQFKFAIAFDRKDTKSIITFQRSQRSCSDEFAKSLASQLNMEHECDDGGMWTDTAAYTDLIPECTNVSVGYENAHGRSEKLNVDYLIKLRDAVIKIDVSKLVESRKAGSYERKSYVYNHSDYHDGWGGYTYKPKEPGVGEYTRGELEALFGTNAWYQWFDWHHESGFWKRRKGTNIPDNVYKDVSQRAKALTSKGKDLGVTKGWKQSALELVNPGDKRGEPTALELKWLITDNHLEIMDLLESFGYDGKSLRAYVEKCGGRSDYVC